MKRTILWCGLLWLLASGVIGCAAVKPYQREYLADRMTAFAASPDARPTDREPIHPTTWLNQGRYDDDPETWQRQSGSSDPRGTAAAVNNYLEAGR